MHVSDALLWLRTHFIAVTLPVFVLITAAAYWPGRRAAIEQDGLIPFRDDQ